MSAQDKKRRQRGTRVGAVSVLAPTGGSPYFRLTWTEPDGRPGRTSGGRTEKGARAKATEINAMLERAAGATGALTLGEIKTQYVSGCEGRNHKTGGDWTETHRTQTARKLNRALHGFEHLQGWDVDRALLDRMRAQAGTRRTVKENTTALRGMLRWGHTQSIFSAAQAECLPERCAEVKPARKGTAAPSRRRRGRAVVESEEYIREEDAPSAQQVIRLGEELMEYFSWGRLAPELGAGSGPRWGEQFQLTAYDCLLDEEDPYIGIDWQIDPAARVRDGGNRRKLPKGEKTRVTGVPEVTFTGYGLLDALADRCDRALWEQRRGTNPQALLFPSVTGRLLHHSSFMSDYFAPAAIRAEWPHRNWVEVRDQLDKRTGTYREITRNRRQFVLTWHSLRHRFARYCVDVLEMKAGDLMAIGGWESETVVKNRYYRSGAEHTASGLAKFRVARRDP